MASSKKRTITVELPESVSEIEYARLANIVWAIIPRLDGAAVVPDKYANVAKLDKAWEEWVEVGRWADWI